MFMYIFTTGAYPHQHFIVANMPTSAHKWCMKGHILATGTSPHWHNILADMPALTYKSFPKHLKTSCTSVAHQRIGTGAFPHQHKIFVIMCCVSLSIWYLYIYWAKILITNIWHKYSWEIYSINILQRVSRLHNTTYIFRQWWLFWKFHSIDPLHWCAGVPFTPFTPTYHLLTPVYRSCQSPTSSLSFMILLLWNT